MSFVTARRKCLAGFGLGLLAIGIFASSAIAAPEITKVEPPNWWVPYARNPIQVLLTGSELKDAQVSAGSPGFKVEVRQSSENGRYLFLYVTIDQATKPGKYKFNVKTASGASDFEL